MAYRVEFTPRAVTDLDELYKWVRTHAPYRGPIWFDRFEESILSLRNYPERCPVVDSLSIAEISIRRLVFGRGRNKDAAYSTVFARVVKVLHVRHGARKNPRRQELLDRGERLS